MFNRLITSLLPLFPEKFIWLFSKSYIAGETIDDAMRVSKELNSRNIMVTIDVLGEFITTPGEAEENKKDYLNLMDVATANGIRGNFSLKPTSFGMLLDKETCYRHIREIVSKAALLNNFIRIDMEDSPCTDCELELFRKLRTEFPASVGLVLQAYLKRTYNDLEKLNDLNSPAIPLNYRICKGIYNEPEKISFKKHDEINSHYLEDIEFLFRNNIYAGIATHDKYLIDSVLKLIDKYRVGKNMYEFQMLYGVTPNMRDKLVRDGHPVRVYVPFGKKWFGYSTRRLKENPKIASHIIKALFYKG